MDRKETLTVLESHMWLKYKKSGLYQTKEYKDTRRKYYLENRERIRENHRKFYLKKKKEGYFNTKEFKDKRHQYSLEKKKTKL